MPHYEPDATPTAQIRPEQIRASVILCCGEDKGFFVAALGELGFPLNTPLAEFRGYSIWTHAEITIVLASIGTGSVEPILYELLGTGRVERIVLVGTAGRLGARPLALGTAFAISEAYLSGTGLDREVKDQPLRPHWPGLENGPPASIVSSAFFYGFSPALRPGDYRHRLPCLRQDFERLVGQVDLVDMEVAQFYALCRLMPEQPGLCFLAFKGASNAVENHGEQNAHAPSVLLNCLRQALAVLGLGGDLRAGRVEHPPGAGGDLR